MLALALHLCLALINSKCCGPALTELRQLTDEILWYYAREQYTSSEVSDNSDHCLRAILPKNVPKTSHGNNLVLGKC